MVQSLLLTPRLPQSFFPFMAFALLKITGQLFCMVSFTFLMTQPGLLGLGQEYLRRDAVFFSLHPIAGERGGHTVSVCPINGGVNFDYLIQVVSARFLHYKFIPFSSLCNELFIYVVTLLRLYEHLISHPTSTPSFNIH